MRGRHAGEMVAEIMERARYLDARDRMVFAMLGNKNLSQREVAQIVGMSESTLCRRIKRIWRRLDDPMVRALIEQKGVLREEFWELAIEHFLHGANAKQLAEKHRMGVTEVRKVIWLIQGWFKGRQSRGRI